MKGTARQHVARLLMNKERRAQTAWTLAVCALMVSFGVGIGLMRRGVALTRTERVLDCPESGVVAHTHNADCYDAEGNLVCPLPERPLHVHDDSCYTETRELVCGLSEHTHTDACYDAEGSLTCGLSEHTHTDACYATRRELTCTRQELTVEHVHGPGCFRTVTVEDQTQDATTDEGGVPTAEGATTEDAATATHPAQTFRHEFTTTEADGTERVVLSVFVDAPEGALPQGASLKATWVGADELTAKQQAAVEGAVAAKVAGKICRQQAVDLAFFDAQGNEVEPAVPVVVTFASELLETKDKPVVVHIDDLTERQLRAQEKALASGKTPEQAEPRRTAETIDELSEHELSRRDLTLAEDELAFESDTFSTYVLALTTLEHTMRAEGETVTVQATAPAEAGIPADAVLRVREVSQGADGYDAYAAQAAEALDAEASQVALARFFDITIEDGAGNEVQPSAPVAVSVSLTDAPAEACEAGVVHFDATSGEPEPVAAQESDGTVSFDAAGFSVYGIVYTVDFHWEVDGQTYDLSVAGGETLSLREVLRALNVVPAEELADFMGDIARVEFSDPTLMHVAQVTADTTAGALKQSLGLKPEYSAELSADDIARMDAKQLVAPDWALVSLKAFDTEETLTITLADGQVLVLKVTDAQDPSVFLGKDVIIHYDGRAMTSNWENGCGRTDLASVEESNADSVDAAKWRIEQGNGGYYLRSNKGTYLKLERGDINLVSNQSEATLLTIQPGSNPDYLIYANNDQGAILTYCDNTAQYDGYFCAPGGTYQGTTNRTWIYIREAMKVDNERRGDWLVYLDEKRDVITLHVGETLTLRPYDEWTWKESDIQFAYWNVGGVNDWTISGSEKNGDKTKTWNDGVFQWTRYVKYDNQLITRYWSVQGKATAVGDYTLTNTNGRTITVHVVPGDPVNQPPTITNTAAIKVNLFDYDKDYLLDPTNDTNLASNNNNKSDSINKYAWDDGSHLYFLSSGSGTSATDTWNNYTRDAANCNIVQNELDSNGYPVLSNWNNKGGHTSLQYLFDTSEASQSWHGGNNNDAMIAYPNVEGMFQRDSNGYYYYNSNSNYFYYDTVAKKSYLYEHTYTQTSGEAKGSLVNDKPIGFFPFHPYDSTSNLYVNQNHALNHHVGLSMDIDFILPTGKLDENGQPYVFDFSGDDDLWVFLQWTDADGTVHSKRMLDLGGIHQPITGSINFTNDDSIKANQPYRLKVFYLERGGCDSNCSIRFNLPVVKQLSLAKRLTGLTEAERAKYKNEKFSYKVYVGTKGNEHLYNGNDTILTHADGTVEQGFTITNGHVELMDGDVLTITGLPRNGTFYAAEENSLNMEQFEAPHAERTYHDDADASEHEEEIVLEEEDVPGTQKIADWKTPEYELQDTELVTFTNTLKEKDLEVEKKWEGDKAHPSEVKFTVSASVEGDNHQLVPYAVSSLKEADGTTDRQFTLKESENWRVELEHLPAYTPDGKLIRYDIEEVDVKGYLSSVRDLTAETYHYCDVDAVKLWPDGGAHDEVITVKLRRESDDTFYAGVDGEGEAVFGPEDEAVPYELNAGNGYAHRFERLPYGDAYTVVQGPDQDDHTQGLVTYVRNIIQYQVKNTPTNEQVDPEAPQDNPVIHKRIDALRDGAENPDSPHTGEDKTDLYRLYLDYKVDSLQSADGVDLLFVIDHSGSMNSNRFGGNVHRAPSVMEALNGDEGLIAQFLDMNKDADGKTKNRWAAVGFKGPYGGRYVRLDLWGRRVDSGFRSENAGESDSEILSGGKNDYTWKDATRDISLPLEGTYPIVVGLLDSVRVGETVLTDYTAGFWRAEQFLLQDEVKTDGRKKVVIFISDGIPTLHIPGLETDQSLARANQVSGSKYYPDDDGGCPEQTKTEFGYFVKDMNANGYRFGDNMELYTIGFGGTMQTDAGEELLTSMLGIAYGDDGHAKNFMTITDVDGNRWYSDTASNKLKSDLQTIMGMNETFSNITIQDDLSRYVELYPSANESDLLKSAKAKVTMTVPNPSDPEHPTVVVLWDENGASSESAAKFTPEGTSQGTSQVKSIVKGLEYDPATQTVKAVFDPAYEAVEGNTYTLSFDVRATKAAYDTYAASGYDKATGSDGQQHVIVGDPETDFLGTDPANATSANKPGFHSNDGAKTTYDHNGKPEEKEYPHPVIQVSAQVDIVKTDETGAALEGAKFNLYDESYDAAKDFAANAAHLLAENLQSTREKDAQGKPTGDAVIRSGKLGVGTYYLVETEAPAGYLPLAGPVKITVSADENGVLSVAAWLVGTEGDTSVGNKLAKDATGVWKLKVQNSSGRELPNAGGCGTWPLHLAGAVMIAVAAAVLARRRRSWGIG